MYRMVLGRSSQEELLAFLPKEFVDPLVQEWLGELRMDLAVEPPPAP